MRNGHVVPLTSGPGVLALVTFALASSALLARALGLSVVAFVVSVATLGAALAGIVTFVWPKGAPRPAPIPRHRARAPSRRVRRRARTVH